MASVLNTIIPMIRSYPSLYPNRLRALEHLFSHYGTHWDGGELIDEEIDEHRVYGTWMHDTSKDECESLRLMHLRDNAIMKYTVDNAEAIAAYGGLHEDVDGGWMHTNHFDDMPEDVTQDWFTAAQEVALAMILNFDKVPETDPYYGHKKDTATKARRFMLRHGLLSNSERESRIAELEAELAMLKEQGE